MPPLEIHQVKLSLKAAWRAALEVFWAMVLATYAALHLAMALLALLSLGILTPLLVLLGPVVHVYLKLFSAQLLGQYGRAHLKHG